MPIEVGFQITHLILFLSLQKFILTHYCQSIHNQKNLYIFVALPRIILFLLNLTFSVFIWRIFKCRRRFSTLIAQGIFIRFFHLQIMPFSRISLQLLLMFGILGWLFAEAKLWIVCLFLLLYYVIKEILICVLLVNLENKQRFSSRFQTPKSKVLLKLLSIPICGRL